MKNYGNLRDPSVDLSLYLRQNWVDLPPEVQDEVIKWDGPGNNQDRNGFIVECMYAHRDKPGVANNAAREIMAGIAVFYGGMGLLHFRDGRGEAMSGALLRESGEPGYNQAVEMDPAPLPEYLPAPQMPEIPAP